MNEPSFHRAMILQRQGRHADAERELRQALTADPHDAMAHAMLGLCLTAQGDYAQATREAQQAIGLAPDLPFAHYAMGLVLSERHRYEEAEAAILEAIRLDPYDPDSFAQLSQIRLNLHRWPSALEAAEQGLALDPQHTACTNLRAMALVKLGRRDDAARAFGDALAQDPDNAFTHANKGWLLLHEGKHQQAMEHFREALRLDPTMDWARAGIVEALKARNVIYRWLLMYFLWMSRLSGQARWGIILGAFFGYQVLRGVARSNPQLATIVWPLLALYLIFAVLTWLADPLFNLLLRLNRFGKLALSREQIITSNWVGALLLLVILALVARLATGDGRFVEVALVSGLLLLPLSAIFKVPEGWQRITMIAGTIALALVGFGGVGLFFMVDRELSTARSPLIFWGDKLLWLFVICAILSQFAAITLGQTRQRR